MFSSSEWGVGPHFLMRRQQILGSGPHSPDSQSHNCLFGIKQTSKQTETENDLHVDKCLTCCFTFPNRDLIKILQMKGMKHLLFSGSFFFFHVSQLLTSQFLVMHSLWYQAVLSSVLTDGQCHNPSNSCSFCSYLHSIR